MVVSLTVEVNPDARLCAYAYFLNLGIHVVMEAYCTTLCRRFRVVAVDAVDGHAFLAFFFILHWCDLQEKEPGLHAEHVDGHLD